MYRIFIVGGCYILNMVCSPDAIKNINYMAIQSGELSKDVLTRLHIQQTVTKVSGYENNDKTKN